MDPSVMKITGIVLLIVAVICVFVAFERYNTNAGNVRAMNNFTRNTPLGDITGGMKVKPAMPAATKYAIFFAIISGAAGGFMLYTGMKSPQNNTTKEPEL